MVLLLQKQTQSLAFFINICYGTDWIKVGVGDPLAKILYGVAKLLWGL